MPLSSVVIVSAGKVVQTNEAEREFKNEPSPHQNESTSELEQITAIFIHPQDSIWECNLEKLSVKSEIIYYEIDMFKISSTYNEINSFREILRQISVLLGLQTSVR